MRSGNVHFCSVSGGGMSVFCAGMDDLTEAIHKPTGTMSGDDIIRRFKKIFGREMTPSECRVFFLPRPEASPQERKG
jgi:hypothetical protein